MTLIWISSGCLCAGLVREQSEQLSRPDLQGSHYPSHKPVPWGSSSILRGTGLRLRGIVNRGFLLRRGLTDGYNSVNDGSLEGNADCVRGGGGGRTDAGGTGTVVGGTGTVVGGMGMFVGGMGTVVGGW